MVYVKDEYQGKVCVTGRKLLEHRKDSYHWVVISLEWNYLYSEKINIFDEFKIFQDEIVFENKGKSTNAFFEH